MNANYGSELHLLRWMGRHRKKFLERVCESSRLSGVDMLDFNFGKIDGKLDGELTQLSFLGGRLDYDDIRREFKKFWKGGTLNWDAIGYSSAEDTYVLCEAKANLKEIVEDRERAKKEDILHGFQRAFERMDGEALLEVCPNEKWVGRYYQMANRIFVQRFLERVGVKAVQLNIYFLGDRVNRGKVFCPRNKAEWQDSEGGVNDEFRELGVDRNSSFFDRHMRELFLEVC